MRTPSTTAEGRKTWLPVWLGAFLALYAFGWLVEAAWNRHGLSYDVSVLLSGVLGVWLLSLAWVGGMILLRRRLARPRSWFKAAWKFGGGLAVGALAVLAGYVSSDLAHDNLRVVVAGQVYRSGQMDADELARCIQAYGIRSIVNLRGKNPAASWYQTEIATSKEYKVVHCDWAFSSGGELSVKRMRNLVALLRRAPKPVLIHCAGGADRSGLACALYCLAVEGEKPSAADRQLSFWNGHVPLVRPKVIAMDDSFWRYATNRLAGARHTEPSWGAGK
jgi:protein tyrosine/serine phosphatase